MRSPDVDKKFAKDRSRMESLHEVVRDNVLGFEGYICRTRNSLIPIVVRMNKQNFCRLRLRKLKMTALSLGKATKTGVLATSVPAKLETKMLSGLPRRSILPRRQMSC